MNTLIIAAVNSSVWKIIKYNLYPFFGNVLNIPFKIDWSEHVEYEGWCRWYWRLTDRDMSEKATFTVWQSKQKEFEIINFKMQHQGTKVILNWNASVSSSSLLSKCVFLPVCFRRCQSAPSRHHVTLLPRKRIKKRTDMSTSCHVSDNRTVTLTDIVCQ